MAIQFAGGVLESVAIRKPDAACLWTPVEGPHGRKRMFREKPWDTVKRLNRETNEAAAKARVKCSDCHSVLVDVSRRGQRCLICGDIRRARRLGLKLSDDGPDRERVGTGGDHAPALPSADCDRGNRRSG